MSVEGVARAGYRAGTVTSLGPLGTAPILDTPYTVNVLPSELIVNGQVKNFKEASKYLPLVEFQEMQGSEILRPATRGMQGSNMQNARMDGIQGAVLQIKLKHLDRANENRRQHAALYRELSHRSAGI